MPSAVKTFRKSRSDRSRSEDGKREQFDELLPLLCRTCLRPDVLCLRRLRVP